MHRLQPAGGAFLKYKNIEEKLPVADSLRKKGIIQ